MTTEQDIIQKPKQKRKRKSTQYVNNKDFYDALVKFKQSCLEAEEYNKANPLSKKPLPRIPEYIGACVFHIATNLMKKPNFYNYSYKDEMISDAYEDCVKNIHSFNPEKSINPFAYFTTVCWWAAVRRLKKEKKQTLVKSEIIRNSGILELGIQDLDKDSPYENTYLTFLQENLDTIKSDAEKNSDKFTYKKTTKAHQQKMADKQKILDDLENSSVEHTVKDYTPEDIFNTTDESYSSTKDYYEDLDRE